MRLTGAGWWEAVWHVCYHISWSLMEPAGKYQQLSWVHSSPCLCWHFWQGKVKSCPSCNNLGALPVHFSSFDCNESLPWQEWAKCQHLPLWLLGWGTCRRGWWHLGTSSPAPELHTRGLTALTFPSSLLNPSFAVTWLPPSTAQSWCEVLQPPRELRLSPACCWRGEEMKKTKGKPNNLALMPASYVSLGCAPVFALSALLITLCFPGSWLIFLFFPLFKNLTFSIWALIIAVNLFNMEK